MRGAPRVFPPRERKRLTVILVTLFKWLKETMKEATRQTAGFKFWLCHLPGDLCSHFLSLQLSFLPWKIGRIMVPPSKR